MAKKKTTDAASPAPRRRTARQAAAAPPVDGIVVPESREPISEASDTAVYAPTYDDIAREAYLRYLRRGGAHGLDVDDWIEAERELRERR